MKVDPVIRDTCGTDAGYKMHQKRVEFPCDPCRLAHNAYVRSRYSPEKRKVYSDEYRNRPGNREKARQRTKKWREQNPEWALENVKKWIANNPEQYRQERVRSAARRRAKLAEVLSEPYTVQDVLDRWGSNCHLCDEPINLTASRRVGEPNWEHGLHLDHVIPISKGGVDTLDNVKPSHGKCNIEKHTDVT